MYAIVIKSICNVWQNVLFKESSKWYITQYILSLHNLFCLFEHIIEVDIMYM